MRTRKVIFVGILFLLTAFHIMAQEKGKYYYYYMGEKQYLTLDKTKLGITTTPDFDESAIGNGLQLKSLNAEKGEATARTKFGSIQFQSKLSDAEYDQKVRSLKSRKDVVAVNPCFIDENNDSVVSSSFFYVKLKESTDYARLEQFSKEKKVVIVKQNKFMPLWYILQCTQETDDNVLLVANAFYESGFFEAASPDLSLVQLFSNASVPAAVSPAAITSYCNDSLFQYQWGLMNNSTGFDIRAYQAWGLSQGKGVKVAVLDSGIDKTHVDLAANISSLSYDADGGLSPSTVHRNDDHGTQCAGVIGAIKDNNIQIVGVAPQCTLISISKNMNTSSAMSANMFADGINWAWKNGADVINCSWGDFAYSPVLKDAIDSALVRGRGGKGCVLVFSAGNGGRQVGFPANSNPDLVVVAAICKDGSRHLTSNFGACIDLVAPGDSILTTTFYNQTTYGGQTSMAAPHVAGVAALMLSYNPYLTAKKVHQILEVTARKIPCGEPYYPSIEGSSITRNTSMGCGLVDAFAALQESCTITFLSGENVTGKKTIGDYYVVVGGTTVQPSANLAIEAVEEIEVNSLEVKVGGELEIKIHGL